MHFLLLPGFYFIWRELAYSPISKGQTNLLNFRFVPLAFVSVKLFPQHRQIA